MGVQPVGSIEKESFVSSFQFFEHRRNAIMHITQIEQIYEYYIVAVHIEADMLFPVN